MHVFAIKLKSPVTLQHLVNRSGHLLTVPFKGVEGALHHLADSLLNLLLQPPQLVLTFRGLRGWQGPPDVWVHTYTTKCWHCS